MALVTVFQMGDSLSLIAWAGVIGMSAGIFSMALGVKLQDRKGIYLALLNAFVIAGYTLVDGSGVRRSGSPAAYTLWIFLLTGVLLAVVAALRETSILFGTLIAACVIACSAAVLRLA